MTDARTIPTSRGGEAIVDAEDYDRLARYRWTLSNHGYAMRGTRGTTVLMQREVLGARLGQIVHHINGNRLDNRKANLMVTTARVHARLHDRVKPRRSIGLRVDEDLADHIDVYAAKHAVSRAEAIRRLLTLGLHQHRLADD